MDAGYILTLHLHSPTAVLKKNKKIKVWRRDIESVDRTIESWRKGKYWRVVEATVDRPGEGRIRG